MRITVPTVLPSLQGNIVCAVWTGVDEIHPPNMCASIDRYPNRGEKLSHILKTCKTNLRMTRSRCSPGPTIPVEPRLSKIPVHPHETFPCYYCWQPPPPKCNGDHLPRNSRFNGTGANTDRSGLCVVAGDIHTRENTSR